jgi:hypothetical protein
MGAGESTLRRDLNVVKVEGGDGYRFNFGEDTGTVEKTEIVDQDVDVLVAQVKALIARDGIGVIYVYSESTEPQDVLSEGEIAHISAMLRFRSNPVRVGER